MFALYRVGERVEVFDKDLLSRVQVAQVVKAVGRRLEIHYLDGRERKFLILNAQHYKNS